MACTKHLVFKIFYLVSLAALVPFYIYRFTEVIATIVGSESLHLLVLTAIVITLIADTIFFISGIVFVCSSKKPTSTTSSQVPNATNVAANSSPSSSNEKLLKTTIILKGTSVFCSLVAIAVGFYINLRSVVLLFAFNIIMTSASALFAFLLCND